MSTIQYGIIVGGLIFYVVIINTLIQNINQQNFNKSFLRLVDINSDQVITHKQIEQFKPCENYSPDILDKAFDRYGRKVDIIDLADQLTEPKILKMISKCLKGNEKLNQPTYLSGLDKKQVVSQMIKGYDINNDDEISFIEHRIGNIINKSVSPINRDIFRFFDKDHDWLGRNNVEALSSYLGGPKRRAPPKKNRRRH